MRNPWILLLAAAAALAALAVLHTLFWGWVYRVRPAHDELRFVETKDGWRIAVARRAPRGEPRLPPVLLCHGLSANRGNLDFGVARWSLALALAEAGFDCFAPDLRGHGGSRRARPGAPRRWSFDTYLAQDIPAVLDDIRAATGSERVLWVGHSQGALLGLVAAGMYPARIAGVVAMAPPTHFSSQDALRRLLPYAFLATGRGHRLLARAGCDLWAGEKEYWNAGREAGLSVDYGHSDLIFGRRAPEEIYPRVEQWLVAHSEKAPPPPLPA